VRIAITGALGRVGRVVVDLATSQGHSVVAIDRLPHEPSMPVANHVQVDMADYAAVERAISGCDALVHLAAIPGPGWRPDHVVHNDNVTASYNALRAAAEVGIDRVCQASSINAIGGRFSRVPRYDYFPLDERHPSYAEDPYSLSKWLCEQQADAMARRYQGMAIASLRLHGVVADLSETGAWVGRSDRIAEKQLWGYVDQASAAQAFLLGLTADFEGHEVFYIVAPETMVETPSSSLASEHYPEVPIHGRLTGTQGFFDCSKARSMLEWTHDGA
jgi:nucleoside-diphosphate-sugar epimerase